MSRLTLPSIERIPGGRGFASLSRRVRALIISGTLFLALFIVSLALPVPYVVLSPGPTCNTLGTADGAHCVGGSDAAIISISGRQPNKTSGNLNLTTVSESGDKITAFQAFVGWLSSDQTVVPYSSIHTPGTTEEQQNAENSADFSQSQDNAIATASCALGYPKRYGVVGVLLTGAAHGVLQPGDVLRSLNGTAVSSQTQLQSVLDATTPKQKASVGITRAGKDTTVSVTLGPTLSGHSGGSLGISVGTVCAMPFSVDLGLGNEIGGPSAGLMFTLGIMDKVGPTDLTGGRFVAGTGTITPTDDSTFGAVGPIGGIQLKMIAARRAGATVFLAPAGNCTDVRGSVPAGLTVAKVSTLQDALAALADIRAGRTAPGC